MAFGMHNILSTRSNRKMQNDYRFRASHRKSALRSYLSKAKRSGEAVEDFMSTADRKELRLELKMSIIKRTSLNLIVLLLVFLLMYSMVSYMS